MRVIIFLSLYFAFCELLGQTTDELNQQAIELSRKGETRQAIKTIDKSLRADPDKKETHFAYGLILMAKNDVKAAESRFLKAIQLDSAYADPYDYLSIIYFQGHDLNRALECFDKSISIRPTIIRLLGRADIRAMLGDYAGSMRDCDDLLMLDPKNPNAYFTRGNAKFGLRDKDGACADLRRAIELGKPKDAFFSKYCEN